MNTSSKRIITFYGRSSHDKEKKRMGAVEAQKPQSDVPVCTVDELGEADAIIFGTPTRFGNMCGQMRQFLSLTEINPLSDSHLLVMPDCAAMVLERCHGLFRLSAVIMACLLKVPNLRRFRTLVRV